MGNFLTSSSIGRKLVMSISGAFLVLFLIFHLAMNSTLLFSEESYNLVTEFLGANWYALVGTLILALGVVVHIFYALILTLQNRRARGKQRYAVTVKEEGVSWASKNMFVLGLIIALGLVIHLYNFWWNMQFVEIIGGHENSFGHHPQDGVSMVREVFSSWIYLVIYLVWFAAIWFHLTHGVWSMFQSVGWANKRWYRRLKVGANTLSTLIVLGYAAIAIVSFLRASGCSICS
ncbi:MAG: succinate dehydrogenase cytochrome b subunit [Alistipes sp.]|nr:succinate dehydrogenase cytochrome b subunit [Alistipes sp.]